ncbi:MAG: hypothetical protein AAGK21_15990 [Bacteroidota bacterium]
MKSSGYPAPACWRQPSPAGRSLPPDVPTVLSPSIACCVEVPAHTGLVRYGLTELLRVLGLSPDWHRRGDARLVVALDEEATLRVTTDALAHLDRPGAPAAGPLAHVEIDGERWPVPVGRSGKAPLGDLAVGAAWWLAGIQERGGDRDRHDRFPYAASLQAALGDAPGGPLRPAVDAYRQRMAVHLRTLDVDLPGRSWAGAPWAVALTHDLDAVRTRRLRAALGEIASGRLGRAWARAFGPDRRLASIDALHALSARHRTRATWMVKPAAWTPEDIPGGLSPALVERLRRWRSEGHEIGWHPGYGVHGHPERWDEEAQRVTEAFGEPPRIARTHFLRWRTPETLRQLARAGVRIDSTLGFAEHEGWRRGTAHPFPLWDAGSETVTELWEMPLAVMDTTLTDYRGLAGAPLADALRRVFDAAEATGGVAVVLWHNQIDGDTAAWTDRLAILDDAVADARRRGARIGPLASLLDAWENPEMR